MDIFNRKKIEDLEKTLKKREAEIITLKNTLFILKREYHDLRIQQGERQFVDNSNKCVRSEPDILNESILSPRFIAVLLFSLYLSFVVPDLIDTHLVRYLSSMEILFFIKIVTAASGLIFFMLFAIKRGVKAEGADKN